MPLNEGAFMLPDRGVHPRTHLPFEGFLACRATSRGEDLSSNEQGDASPLREDAMTPALLGKKIGTTRVYDEKGSIVPVTVVEAGPCAVTQVKTTETDGYNAVQLGFKDIKPKFSTQPLI